jgi:hypothetical protein
MAGAKKWSRVLSVLEVGSAQDKMTTAWGRVLPDDGQRGIQDLGFYVAAVLAGGFAGWVDLKVGDLLLTALVVLVPCMILGVWRPSRPWRWVAIVGICVPIAELLGYLLLTERPYRAQIYESFLAFLPGIAGAYGGAMMRRALGNIFADR